MCVYKDPVLSSERSQCEFLRCAPAWTRALFLLLVELRVLLLEHADRVLGVLEARVQVTLVLAEHIIMSLQICDGQELGFDLLAQATLQGEHIIVFVGLRVIHPRWRLAAP
jgi:hypothetical protein